MNISKYYTTAALKPRFLDLKPSNAQYHRYIEHRQTLQHEYFYIFVTAPIYLERLFRFLWIFLILHTTGIRYLKLFF